MQLVVVFKIAFGQARWMTLRTSHFTITLSLAPFQERGHNWGFQKDYVCSPLTFYLHARPQL